MYRSVKNFFIPQQTRPFFVFDKNEVIEIKQEGSSNFKNYFLVVPSTPRMYDHKWKTLLLLSFYLLWNNSTLYDKEKEKENIQRDREQLPIFTDCVHIPYCDVDIEEYYDENSSYYKYMKSNDSLKNYLKSLNNVVQSDTSTIHSYFHQIDTSEEYLKQYGRLPIRYFDYVTQICALHYHYITYHFEDQLKDVCNENSIYEKMIISDIVEFRRHHSAEDYRCSKDLSKFRQFFQEGQKDVVDYATNILSCIGLLYDYYWFIILSNEPADLPFLYQLLHYCYKFTFAYQEKLHNIEGEVHFSNTFTMASIPCPDSSGSITVEKAKMSDIFTVLDIVESQLTFVHVEKQMINNYTSIFKLSTVFEYIKEKTAEMEKGSNQNDDYPISSYLSKRRQLEELPLKLFKMKIENVSTVVPSSEHEYEEYMNENYLEFVQQYLLTRHHQLIRSSVLYKIYYDELILMKYQPHFMILALKICIKIKNSPVLNLIKMRTTSGDDLHNIDELYPIILLRFFYLLNCFNRREKPNAKEFYNYMKHLHCENEDIKNGAPFLSAIWDKDFLFFKVVSSDEEEEEEEPIPTMDNMQEEDEPMPTMDNMQEEDEPTPTMDNMQEEEEDEETFKRYQHEESETSIPTFYNHVSEKWKSILPPAFNKIDPSDYDYSFEVVGYQELMFLYYTTFKPTFKVIKKFCKGFALPSHPETFVGSMLNSLKKEDNEKKTPEDILMKNQYHYYLALNSISVKNIFETIQYIYLLSDYSLTLQSAFDVYINYVTAENHQALQTMLSCI